MPDLSIVFPTYNEKENIKILIPLVEELFLSEKISFEVLVVDDSSPDGTAQTADDLNKKYGNVRVILRKKKEGIGAALREGYNNAAGKLILSCDSDMSFDINDMLKLYKKINEGYDLVIGNRHSGEGKYIKPTPAIKLKALTSKLGNKAVRSLTGINIHDFSVNFRAIKTDVWRSIKTTENTNSILLEMIMKAGYKGFKIGEIPIVFKDRLYGESKLNLKKEAPKFLLKLAKFVIKYRVFRMKG